MTKNFVCIVCPNGCALDVETDGSTLVSVKGNGCPKGKSYAEEEMLSPKRTVTSSVLVTGGVLPLASVRLTEPVPKERIPEVMAVIRKIRLEAPVHRGQVLVERMLGYESDLIVTRDVPSHPSRSGGRTGVRTRISDSGSPVPPYVPRP
jgi:CxxC motif-containing protein